MAKQVFPLVCQAYESLAVRECDKIGKACAWRGLCVEGPDSGTAGIAPPQHAR
jgi:hypothetical protein